MSERPVIFREEHKIHTYHVDFERKITIPSVFLFLQEIAWHHANEHGFGFHHLQEKGLFWVLSKAKVLMHQYPHWNDVLHLETWAKEPERLTAYRDFQGFDQYHRLLFSATSSWHVLSTATNRPQRLDDFRKNFPAPEGKHAMEEKLEKLPDTKTISPENRPCEQSNVMPVLPSDIDMNRHVNNTRYVQWAIDAFGFDFLQQHILSEIEINFLWQAVPGGRYIISSCEYTTNEYLQCIVRESDNKELARLRTKWIKY